MQHKKLVEALVSIGLVGALAGCGGVGGSNGSTTAPTAPTVATATTGTVNMLITDGPSDAFNHVWVTVTAISFNTDPNAVWSSSDTTWKTTTLTAPITLDLAALNNGTMNKVFANMTLPVGTYRQARFFFAGDSDPLSSSAHAITDNETTPTPLQWNDQVEYTNSLGVIAEAPLEIAHLLQGIQLLGTFSVTAGSTLNFVTDFNLDKIVVPFSQDGKQAFTLRPDLRYFDLSQSGAITGTLDPVQICLCNYNLIAHAEVLSADGTHHEVVRSASVDPVTGTFTLSPLSLNDSNGNPIAYDIVIRGHEVATIVVTGVTPTGTYSVATGTAAPTITGAAVLQSTPIDITTSTEYDTNLLSPLSPLTSGYVIFQQTLPITGVANPVPYEILRSNTDPFTGFYYCLGCLNSNVKLSNSPVMAAPYNAGNALSFTPVTPNEGVGGFSVAANEIAHFNLSNNLLIAAPLSGSLTQFAPPTPTIKDGIVSGSISGNLTIANASAYDRGTLVISRTGQITTSVDVSSLLSSGGAFAISNIPSGSISATVPDAYYYAYIRLWNHGVNDQVKIVPIPGDIDLRSISSITGMNISVTVAN